MKQILFLLACILPAGAAFAQTLREQKFSRILLAEDLDFIHNELFHAHANPFTEIDSLAYEARFQEAKQALRDSMTALDLAKIAKPLFAPLSDEHSRLGIDLSKTWLGTAPVFLPFNLEKRGNAYVVKDWLSNTRGLNAGDTVLAIGGISMAEILKNCANFTTGFPEQRQDKALQQLGVAYAFAYPNKPIYQLKSTRGQLNVGGIGFQTWKDYLNGANKGNNCTDLIHYQRIGETGYIEYCSFSVGSDSAFQQLEAKIAGIFEQVKKDKVKNLVIDVSHNSGGNSSCGDLIINYFYSKPYQTYQCKWKRSNEYLALIKKWGSNNNYYENQPVGSVISFPPDTQKPPKRLKDRFKGKVYVVVGAQTFSSAIMFATIVKDNHIATLAGQIPDNGHPNHFGEMYGSTAPHTGLSLQFGVKEWIRPSGIRTDNHLYPDKEINLSEVKNAEDLVRRVTGDGGRWTVDGRR